MDSGAMALLAGSNDGHTTILFNRQSGPFPVDQCRCLNCSVFVLNGSHSSQLRMCVSRGPIMTTIILSRVLVALHRVVVPYPEWTRLSVQNIASRFRCCSSLYIPATVADDFVINLRNEMVDSSNFASCRSIGSLILKTAPHIL